MNIQTLLRQMALNINECVSATQETTEISWNDLHTVSSIVSSVALQISLKSDSQIQYGRYLIFKNDLFNIQLDVFSHNYVGAPHNHETWGVMCAISGELGVADYVRQGDNLTLIRKGILKPGATTCFMKSCDWHSTETFGVKQVVSFHIYGSEFNLQTGLRYEGEGRFVKYERGVLYDFANNPNMLKVNS